MQHDRGTLTAWGDVRQQAVFTLSKLTLSTPPCTGAYPASCLVFPGGLLIALRPAPRRSTGIQVLYRVVGIESSRRASMFSTAVGSMQFGGRWAGRHTARGVVPLITASRSYGGHRHFAPDGRGKGRFHSSTVIVRPAPARGAPLKVEVKPLHGIRVLPGALSVQA